MLSLQSAFPFALAQQKFGLMLGLTASVEFEAEARLRMKLADDLTNHSFVRCQADQGTGGQGKSRAANYASDLYDSSVQLTVG